MLEPEVRRPELAVQPELAVPEARLAMLAILATAARVVRPR
jgi:hypothetical protein